MLRSRSLIALVLIKQVIDKHLEGREWLAADQFTLAVRNCAMA